MSIKKNDVAIIALAIALIIILDLMTNSLDTTRNQWDFVYYIAMAKDGFHAENLASPFAYRYITTGIVHILSIVGLSIENGFQLIAYIGAFAQLTGIYFFTKWISNSSRSALITMLVVASSIFNIKFLLFDNYRPDHLAYGLILLQTYFAFEKRFLPLLILTLIGSQLREFNIIPLIAYLAMQAREKRDSKFIKESIISMFLLLAAIALPRFLISVTKDYQIVGFSREKLLNAVILPLIPSVSINFVFSVISYFLPLFLISTPKIIKTTFKQLPAERQIYLLTYIFLVLLLSFFGGTDFTRFATFLFLPQIILVGLLAQNISDQKFIFMFICIFIFNRLWVHFPDWDVQAYRSFYGGFSLVLNQQTWLRVIELIAFLILGYAINLKSKTAQA